MPTRRGTPANQLGSAGAAARAFNFLRTRGSAANRRAANRGYRNAMRTILGSGGSGGGSGSSGG